MKKALVKILCVITVLSLMCPLIVFADSVPATINISGTSVANPGEDAVVVIDVTINAGFDIQGIQVEFDLSENFPKLKRTDIIKNNTGWENVAVNGKSLLGVGNIIETQTQLVAKITFGVPEDAEAGTEYVFTPTTTIVANASQEFETKLNVDALKIVVPGEKPVEDVQKPETKPDETDKETDISISQDKNNTPSDGNSVGEKVELEKENTIENKAEEAKPWKNPFFDVKEKDWFYESVKYVYDNELMSGVGFNEFDPGSSLTRGMLVTILYRFEGSPSSMTYGFSDVPRTEWYTKSVDWAASTGIVNGVGDNRFAPDEPVTREQITVIFYNYSKYKKMDLTAKSDLSSFADSEKISSWATTAFEWAVSSGLISGKDNSMLDPSGKATRAETSAIIKRYAEKMVK
ncbi:MAG: S-layer homology domain-containing protein [Clostridia bacterium]|nr:S-layer homology domain-containing protein [Clostridia bacterium]